MRARCNAHVLLVLGGLVSGPVVGCAPGGAAAPRAPAPVDSIPVGYGVQHPSDVTGAVGSITEPEIRQQNAMRVEELLMGRIPGVSVYRTGGGELAVRVRGGGPDGSGDPLYVLDGMPLMARTLTRALGSISTGDIERIDVLKDAAAGVYGVRAVHGVVLITTKLRR